MATKNVKNQSVNSKVSALKSIREANKETKSLSGVIKTIRSFWKDGYKDAFEGYLGLSFQEIELKISYYFGLKAIGTKTKQKCFTRQKSQRKTTKVNTF